MDFRPRITGNRDIDEALRQAFDLIYQLRAQLQAQTPPAPPPAQQTPPPSS